jgi:hypothetical protein
MTFSDSTHFSDKFSYKILFILSYGLKDMNYARLEQILSFFRKQKQNRELFSPK